MEDKRKGKTEGFEGDPNMVALREALTAYTEMFHSTFPTYQFMRPTEDVIACARDCVEQGKDIYELGYIPRPEEAGGIVY